MATNSELDKLVNEIQAAEQRWRDIYAKQQAQGLHCQNVYPTANETTSQLRIKLALGAHLGDAADRIKMITIERNPMILSYWVRLDMTNGCVIRLAVEERNTYGELKAIFSDEVMVKVLLLSDPKIKSTLKIDIT